MLQITYQKVINLHFLKNVWVRLMSQITLFGIILI